MGLTASAKGSFQQVEAGTYPARCIRLIDIGTHKMEYQGKEKKLRQVILTWELPTELIDSGDYAGQPYIVSKFFTLSLHEQAGLRQALESWRGKKFTTEELEGFDLRNILDKCCMIGIVHNEKGNAKVNAIMALPRGITVPDRISPLVEFDLDIFDQKVYDSLTDGIKSLIDSSEERQNGTAHSVDPVPYEETEPEPF